MRTRGMESVRGGVTGSYRIRFRQMGRGARRGWPEGHPLLAVARIRFGSVLVVVLAVPAVVAAVAAGTGVAPVAAAGRGLAGRARLAGGVAAPGHATVGVTGSGRPGRRVASLGGRGDRG